MRDITFIITRGAWDGVNAQYTIAWSKFVSWLPKNRCEVPKKESSMMINTGRFKTINDGAEIATYSKDVINSDGDVIFKKGDCRLGSKGQQIPSRNKNNMIGYDALMLDYDNGTTLQSALDKFSEYELVYYTTYSHLQKGGIEKFRLIIPFTEFCPVEEYIGRKEALTKFVDGSTVDNSTFSPSRAFYLPSMPLGATEYKDGHQTGKFLDWKSLPKDIKKPLPAVNIVKPVTAGKYSKEYMDSVLSQLLGRGQFTYNDCFSLANALHNSGYYCGDFIFFCKFWRPHETEHRVIELWNSSIGRTQQDFDIFVNILNGKSKINFRLDPH